MDLLSLLLTVSELVATFSGTPDGGWDSPLHLPIGGNSPPLPPEPLGEEGSKLVFIMAAISRMIIVLNLNSILYANWATPPQ
jgi:hypothetical protein